MFGRHQLDKVEEWLNEHGFHCAKPLAEVETDHAGQYARQVNDRLQSIRAWLTPDDDPRGGFHWVFRAYAGLYQSAVFDTPWAALAAAELAGWEAEMPRVAGPLVLVQRHHDQAWKRVDTGQWVESVDGQIVASVDFLQDTEVSAAEVAGVQFRLPYVKRLGAGDTLNLTLTVSAS